MKEDAQKSLETLIYQSHHNTAIFIQKWVRGIFARKLFKRMVAAKKTMGRVFVHIAIRLRWRKMITDKRKEIRDARRKIKKFYRRRYFHFKFIAEIDNRIH